MLHSNAVCARKFGTAQVLINKLTGQNIRENNVITIKLNKLSRLEIEKKLLISLNSYLISTLTGKILLQLFLNLL